MAGDDTNIGDFPALAARNREVIQETLPNITASDVIEAGKSLPEGTSPGHEGFHVRHFGILGPRAAEAVACFLGAVEAQGHFPGPHNMVQYCLLPKPTGGRRPIALFASLVRIWSKIRRQEASAWEKANPNECFAAVEGRGPVSTVWRQALRAETLRNKGDDFLCVLLDLASSTSSSATRSSSKKLTAWA